MHVSKFIDRIPVNNCLIDLRHTGCLEKTTKFRSQAIPSSGSSTMPLKTICMKAMYAGSWMGRPASRQP